MTAETKKVIDDLLILEHELKATGLAEHAQAAANGVERLKYLEVFILENSGY